MTLIELLETGYSPLRGLAPKAHVQFAITLRHFGRFLGRAAETGDMNPLAIQAFLLERKKVVSLATVVKDRTHLMALSNWLAREGLIKKFVNLPPLRAPIRIPKAMPWEDLTAVVAKAAALPGTVGDVPARLWWPSFLRSQVETAERLSPHLALRWGDVDLPWLVFRAETRKGQRHDIQRRVRPETAAILAQMQRGDRDHVWPWPHCQHSLWNHMRSLHKAAGVRYRGFHALRRTAASYMAASGGLAQAASLLGHASAETTLRHYVDPSIATPTRSAIDFLPPMK